MIFRKKAFLFIPFMLAVVFVSNALCKTESGRAQVRDEKARRYISPELSGTAVTNKDPASKAVPPPPSSRIDVPDALRACQTGSECVDVPDICDNCHCGTAVNQERYQEYVLLRAKVCGPTPAIGCAADCLGRKADCVRGYCTLVDAASGSGSTGQP